MTVVEKIKTFFWITSLLKRSNYISLADINEEWCHCCYNSDGLPFERNTFRNYLKGIEELFDINIEYNGKGYYIVDPAPLREQNLQTALLHDIEGVDFLSRFRSLGSRIQTEEILEGRQYLSTIAESIKRSYQLKIVHQKFTDSEAHTKTIEPYCLKTVKRRCYILARDLTDSHLKTFALDRILELEMTKEHFKPDESVNVETYFDNSYGIVVDESKVDTVHIRTSEDTAPYIRTLPLHKSQREVAPREFTFRVAKTLEFMNELLRHGEGIEVLAPEDLREEFKARIEKMKAMYEK